MYSEHGPISPRPNFLSIPENNGLPGLFFSCITDMERRPLQQRLALVPTYPHSLAISLCCKVILLSFLWRTLRWELLLDKSAIGHGFNSVIPTKSLTLNNCVHRATFLTEAAVNALCHVNIVSRRPPTPILSLLGLNCNGARRANGFT